MARCLTIRRGYRDSINVGLDGLIYINVVGVVGGHIWITGSSEDKEGELINHEWADMLVKYPNSVSILLTDSKPTTPFKTEKHSFDKLKKQLREAVKQLREIENKSLSKLTEKQNELSGDRAIKTAKVMLGGDCVSRLSGEHIQFEVEYKRDCDFKLFVWSSDNGGNNQVVTHYKSTVTSEKEYVLRFGN